MTGMHMEFISMFQAANSRHPEFNSKYGLRMSWDERLREAFEATGWSKAELARRAAVSYDNVNKYLAGAVKQPRGDTFDKLAHALEIDPVFLATGVNPVTGESIVPLMGYVGAGAEVEPDFEQVPDDGLEQIHVPFHLPADMIAFQVRGDSMLPMFDDGTVIIVFREQRRAIETFYGERAIVRTMDGRRYIKTIIKGEGHLVSLLSWNAQPIQNVAPVWIGEIFTYFPGTSVRRASRTIARQGGIQGQLRLKSG